MGEIKDINACIWGKTIKLVEKHLTTIIIIEHGEAMCLSVAVEIGTFQNGKPMAYWHFSSHSNPNHAKYFNLVHPSQYLTNYIAGFQLLACIYKRSKKQCGS